MPKCRVYRVLPKCHAQMLYFGSCRNEIYYFYKIFSLLKYFFFAFEMASTSTNSGMVYTERVRNKRIIKPIIYGNSAIILPQKINEEHTHKWTVLSYDFYLSFCLIRFLFGLMIEMKIYHIIYERFNSDYMKLFQTMFELLRKLHLSSQRLGGVNLIFRFLYLVFYVN